jgi:hypothetical protein
MARNKLSDLNDHLFAQIEKLTDEDLTTEQLEKELKVADSIADLSSQIIGTHRIVFDAAKLISNGNLVSKNIPETFGLKNVKSLEE